MWIFIFNIWLYTCYIVVIYIEFLYVQLKEMVLALLHESDLVLSDDIIETIVDKVHIYIQLNC